MGRNQPPTSVKQDVHVFLGSSKAFHWMWASCVSACHCLDARSKTRVRIGWDNSYCSPCRGLPSATSAHTLAATSPSSTGATFSTMRWRNMGARRSSLGTHLLTGGPRPWHLARLPRHHHLLHHSPQGKPPLGAHKVDWTAAGLGPLGSRIHELTVALCRHWCTSCHAAWVHCLCLLHWVQCAWTQQGWIWSLDMGSSHVFRTWIFCRLLFSSYC